MRMMKSKTKPWALLAGLLGCLCFGGGDWLMMYGDPTSIGKLKWLTIGTAAIPQWRYILAMVLAFTNVLVIFGILKGISMMMPESGFRLGFTNGLMSESMIIWFLLVFLEIGGRK